jgi:hypothetical protein
VATYTDFLEQSATPPATLWHYTTQHGLLGIVGTNSLWASKVHYLNDSSEFSYTLKLADGILEERLRDGSAGLRDRLNAFREAIPRIDNIHVCVASFSEDPDILSQWRAYGGASGGYALGFVAQHLRESARGQGLFLVKCKYTEAEQRESINHLIDRCMSEESTNPDIALKCWYFPSRLARLAPVLKNSSFGEEREWRLIFRPLMVTQMLFREGRSMLVPYARLELKGELNAYLSSVTIGPCPNMSLSIASTAMLLRCHGVKDAESKVIGSKIPYRNW